MAFLKPPLPMSHFAIFSETPVSPFVIYEKVTNYTKKQKNIFFYISLLKHINIIIETVE